MAPGIKLAKAWAPCFEHSRRESPPGNGGWFDAHMAAKLLKAQL
jgi:hypothetical protein